jgi:futalosine hydrolase
MKTLILVPTEFEADLVRSALMSDPLDAAAIVQVCGFGPVTSGICTARLITQLQPTRIILTGIAGTLSDDVAIGSACHFGSVALYGVGAGQGQSFSTAQELGWAQLSSADARTVVDDIVTLPASGSPNLLVTSCAASSTADEAQWRREKFPHGIAEDMEGFSVAVACLLANIPLEIIRGFSNVAGDRNKQNWRIDEAIAAATDLVMERLS